MKPAPKRFKPGFVALERALSKLGIASRTQARAWIKGGKVRVDGQLRTNPGFGVIPERARIEVEGLAVEKAGFKALALHKPRSTVTTRSDEKGRATVFSLIKEPMHLIAVGRLDWATTGLLLLTNDTQLSNWLTDPANGVRRTYLVTVRGRFEESLIEKLRRGIVHEGETLQADEVALRKASGRESHLTVHLSEGKNREIRRMFLALGHEVTTLKRVAYGGIELGKLAPGEYREISVEELRAAFPGAPIRQTASD